MVLLLQYTLIFASVLILVALGGCFAEHSGVINLGLEGIMIMGALGGALTMRYVPNTAPAIVMLLAVIVVSALVGMVYSCLLAVASINFKADQTLVGTALNLLGTAGATVIVKAINTANNPDDVSSIIQYAGAKKAFTVNIGSFEFSWFMLVTALLLAITLVLDVIDSAVSYMIDTSGGLTVLSFSFVSILVSLISIVLNAGYLCYCLGIRRGEHMPYESLFDAFSFAGKAILLSIVEGIFIGLWSLLFVVPGIIAAYRYSFAMMDLCENPDLGVMEALDLSKQQTYGYKGQLFMLSLSFFGWLLLAGVAVTAVESILFGGVDNILSLETAASLSQAVSSTFLQQLFTSLASVVLTPDIRLSFCGFYLRVTQGDAPQRPQLPEGDPWDNDF